MAIFSLWLLPYKRRGRRIAAGFQNLYNDRGNWTGCNLGLGLQSGTNMSLSACYLTGELGHQVTEQFMRSLTRAQAEHYYKTDFWDAVYGDSINSQVLAEFVADMKSSAGYNGIIEFQKALRSLGYNVSTDGRFGQQTLNATNQAIAQGKQNILYNQFRNNMIAYYRRIGTGTNTGFLPNWLESLDEDYPAIATSAASTGKKGAALLGLGLLGLYLANR